MTEEQRVLVNYRLERAHEAVEEAKLLFAARHLHTYVNRLYYACFYAVSALLLTRKVSTSKHSHLRSLLHRDYIKTGLIPTHLGKHFDLLFNNRQKGDYADLIVFEADEVSGWLQKTGEFVQFVEGIVKDQA